MIDHIDFSFTQRMSRAWRRAYIETALECRRLGYREAKKIALRNAALERLNLRFFLGEAPF